MSKKKKEFDLNNALEQFNRAFAYMSVIPILVCVYLLTGRFYSLEVLIGINGLIVFLVLVLSFLGFIIARRIIRQLVGMRLDERMEIDDLNDVVNKSKNSRQ